MTSSYTLRLGVLPNCEFLYELGWVFIMQSARGRGFSGHLTRETLSGAGTDGLFAISRTDSAGMHATFAKFRLLSSGHPRGEAVINFNSSCAGHRRRAAELRR